MKNTKYIEAVEAYERETPKLAHVADPKRAFSVFREIFRATTGRELSAEDRIVDFGCGSGDAVVYLNSTGLHANGVDILAYWGEDVHLNGAVAKPVPDNLLPRFSKIDPVTNVLPFADNSVDLVYSDQTLEHVFDHQPVFAEQVRVLKPGGLAVHRFPHGATRIEPHTRVPLTALSRFDWYLTLCAMLGVRSRRQANMGWRQVVVNNKGLLATTNYASKSHMLGCVDSRLASATFLTVPAYGQNRASRLYRKARDMGLGGIAGPVLGALQDNRILIIQKHRS